MKLLRIVRWIWEFPQCLLGFILTKIYDVDYSETYKGIDVYIGKFPGGISLGLYILMNVYSTNKVKKHEWGHTRQSIRWGWLYLPIVGLTSIVWCTLHQYNKTLNKKDYDSIWPENMANKYGGL